jgi:hypothetical protein
MREIQTQALIWYFGLTIQSQFTDIEWVKVLLVLTSFIFIIIYFKIKN